MKLLLADDHTLFRDALVQYIQRAEPDAEVLLAKDLPEALKILEGGATPELILLDLKMPGMNGIDGLKTVRERYRDIPVALMSGTAESRDVKTAMDMGAIGYFPKTLSGKALLKAIQLVLTGERFLPIDRDTNEVMPSYYNGGAGAGSAPPYARAATGTGQGAEGLTPRESEVLSYLLSGASNKEIALSLNLQVVTVKLHVRGICRKLGAKNRTQAALKAREMGLVAASH